MPPLVECVPNFSEGRDESRLETIIGAMTAIPGVYLLDREMDHDHNRSVVTIVGAPEAVAEAVVRGVGKASEVIDLNQHQGAHPRIGAADVVPFVPLDGMTLEACVKLAHWAGEEIWKRYRVPVYLYEAAARTPERKNLENIRRGQFEGVREAVRSDRTRWPDIGPDPERDSPDIALHPTAGATVVGARKFLIAYNINLESTDLELARQIARKIRTSSGGLPAVKAMGVILKREGCVQVSMNLTDFEQTSIATVWEAVRNHAQQANVGVRESELVGLAPRRAFEMSAAELLKLREFRPDMIIENRLETVMSSLPLRFESTLAPFISALAAHTAAPGGGTAAAAAGAMAAALGHMVAGMSARKKGLERYNEEFDRLAAEFSHLQREFLLSTDRDAEAYLAVVAAGKLPKASPPQINARARALIEATRRAAEVPLAVAVWARQTRDLLKQLEAIANPAMASDIATGLALADAAFTGAAANVEINLASLPSGNDLGANAALYLRSELERLRTAV